MRNTEEVQLKFYADTPAGQVNKLFVFKVKHYDHAVDLAAKCIQKYGFKIRAAFFQNLRGLSIRFDNVTNLNEHVCSLIIKSDAEALLKIVEHDLKSLPNGIDSGTHQNPDSA